MHECPIGRILREKLGVPVAVRNDGKACAMGEYAVGALKGTRVGVVMAIGTGIGGGVVIDGNVLHGTHCFAGEFSMMRNDAASPLTIPNTFSDLCGWMGLRRFVLEAKGLVNDPAYAEVDGRTIFEWIDGVNFDGGTVYMCTDRTKYADDTANGYTNIGTKSQSDGWIKSIGIPAAAPWAFFPTATGGSETTYIPDYAYYGSGWRVLRVGGSWSYGSNAGLFYFDAYYTSSNAYSIVGARLLFHP